MFLNQNICGWSQSSFIFMQTLRRCRCCRSFCILCNHWDKKYILFTYFSSLLYIFYEAIQLSCLFCNVFKYLKYLKTVHVFVPICLITINLSKYHSKLLRISLSIYHIILLEHIISHRQYKFEMNTNKMCVVIFVRQRWVLLINRAIPV